MNYADREFSSAFHFNPVERIFPLILILPFIEPISLADLDSIGLLEAMGFDLAFSMRFISLLYGLAIQMKK
jgi:hypothetical protein